MHRDQHLDPVRRRLVPITEFPLARPTPGRWLGGPGFLLCASLAQAATLTVSNSNDAGPGSLRQAIADASPGEEIVFNACLRGQTITLSSGPLVIDKDLTITGLGAAELTVSGNGAHRVLTVDDGLETSRRVVRLSGLTFTQGVGAAIYSVEDLTLDAVVITDSSSPGAGGGVVNRGGALTVVNSLLSRNRAGAGGGAIMNDQGTLTVLGSTLSENAAEQSSGGAIYSFYATTTVSHSVVWGNTAEGGAGALYSPGGTLTVTHSTLSGNSCDAGGGGAIYSALGTLNVLQSTIAHNSAVSLAGGIYNPSTTLNLQNSILAGNTAASQPDLYQVGTLVSNGHNLVGVGDDVTGLLGGQDLFGTDTAPLDPELDPLANNGGPTLTQALRSGSPAVDAGHNADAPGDTDQRGYPRIFNEVVDIGAFEYRSTPPPNLAPVARCRDTTLLLDGDCAVTTSVTSINDGSFDPDGDTLSLSFDPVDMVECLTLTGSGARTLTLYVTDRHGVQSSCEATVTTVDLTPPEVACPANAVALATSAAGAVVTFPPVLAADDCEGSAVTVIGSHESGAVFPLGITEVVCVAADAAGNEAVCTFAVQVICEWSGVLPPVDPLGTSVFRAGQTVPIKFLLAGGSAGITDLVAGLSYAHISDAVTGTLVDASSTFAATSGNLFRYDAASGQYIFNWRTRGLTPGTYQLWIDLGDGVERTVLVGLR